MSHALLLPLTQPRIIQAAAEESQQKFSLDGANLIVDANSYYAEWTYNGIQKIGSFATLISEKNMTSANVAIAGISWAVMVETVSKILPHFNPSKKNILVCGETRNQTFEKPGAPWSTAKLIELTRRYIAAANLIVKEKYGKGFDKVVLCGSIPSDGKTSPDGETIVKTANQNMLAFDAYCRDSANLASLGADVFADFRTVHPEYFGGDGWNIEPGFWAQKGVTVKETTGALTHPLGAAREAFADTIAQAIKRLEA